MQRTLAWTTLATFVAAAAPAFAQTYSPGTAYTPSVIDSNGARATGPNGSTADIWNSRSNSAANPGSNATAPAAGAPSGAATAPNGAVGTSGSSMGGRTGTPDSGNAAQGPSSGPGGGNIVR